MKPRLPTPEERRQWRESNRFTEVRDGAEISEIEAGEIPPPIGGRMGGGLLQSGASIGKTEQASAPHLTSPRKGEERARGSALPPLKPLSLRETNRLLKSYPTIEATLDLHGLSKLEAHAQVTTFITRQSGAGRRHAIIITGKGRDGVGVLRANVPHWLNEAPLRPLISALAYASPEKGGAGVLHVLLKRRI